MFPANWILRQTGIDAAAEWRGRYDDEEGAFRFMEEAGGLVAIFDRGCPTAGMVRTFTPGPGAVGVIASPGVRGGVLGGICLGRRLWASVAVGGGLWMVRTRALTAWEF